MSNYEESWIQALYTVPKDDVESRRESRSRAATHEEIIQAIMSTGHSLTLRDASLRALGLLARSFPIAA